MAGNPHACTWTFLLHDCFLCVYWQIWVPLQITVFSYFGEVFAAAMIEIFLANSDSLFTVCVIKFFSVSLCTVQIIDIEITEVWSGLRLLYAWVVMWWESKHKRTRFQITKKKTLLPSRNIYQCYALAHCTSQMYITELLSLVFTKQSFGD